MTPLATVEPVGGAVVIDDRIIFIEGDRNTSRVEAHDVTEQVAEQVDIDIEGGADE